MPELIQSVFVAPSVAHVRLELESFDSGDECSLYHWLQVCQLVEDADMPDLVNEPELADELEPAAWI